MTGTIQLTLLIAAASSLLLCTGFRPAFIGGSGGVRPKTVSRSGTPPALQPTKITPSASSRTVLSTSSRLFTAPAEQSCDKRKKGKTGGRLLQRVLNRFNAVKAAGYDDRVVLGAGLFGRIKNIKKLHNPITYFVLGIFAGFRYDWCFKSPLYWFAMGFTIKWYRARYVFKIPVWDRQPNWNNVITSKDQEKDLKAFTCKNCGSTIFIAKTREFFFEGDTGIGGLGCFSCGAKGKDNFIEDRDRIVEDVGDMDDYFEYERPLDFISRAERRKLLKEVKGDEEKANQLLLERNRAAAEAAVGGEQSDTASSFPAAAADESAEGEENIDAAIIEDEGVKQEQAESLPDVETPETPVKDGPQAESEVETEAEKVSEPVADDVPEAKSEEPVAEKVEHEDEVPVRKEVEKPSPSKPATTKPTKKEKTAASAFDLEGLEELDMDAF